MEDVVSTSFASKNFSPMEFVIENLSFGGMQLLGDNVCEKTKSASWTSDGGSYTLAYKKSLSSSYISPLSLTLGPAPSSKLK